MREKKRNTRGQGENKTRVGYDGDGIVSQVIVGPLAASALFVFLVTTKPVGRCSGIGGVNVIFILVRREYRHKFHA